MARDSGKRRDGKEGLGGGGLWRGGRGVNGGCRSESKRTSFSPFVTESCDWFLSQSICDRIV